MHEGKAMDAALDRIYELTQELAAVTIERDAALEKIAANA